MVTPPDDHDEPDEPDEPQWQLGLDAIAGIRTDYPWLRLPGPTGAPPAAAADPGPDAAPGDGADERLLEQALVHTHDMAQLREQLVEALTRLAASQDENQRLAGENQRLVEALVVLAARVAAGSN
ncbi:MAG: hypothetical protein GY882_14205 [Actinomycetia bacterium]|nr:hypothetical protein [Actinomycetes bacterium]